MKRRGLTKGWRRDHDGAMRSRVHSALSVVLAMAIVASALPASAEDGDAPLTEEQLRIMFPGSYLKQVTPAEFEAAVADPATEAVVWVAPETMDSPEIAWGSRFDRGRFPLRTADGGPMIWVAGGGNVGGVDRGEIAVVLMVVVATVVVAFAVVFTGGYLLKGAFGEWEAEEGWREAGMTYAFFSSQGQGGGMVGARLSGGFLSDFVDVGLTLEGGYLHGRLKPEDDAPSVDVSAGYGMIGPVLHKNIGTAETPLSLDLEVLFGMTTEDALDWIARAQVGLSWPIGKAWNMGLHVGSFRIKLSETDGTLLHKESYNLTGGISLHRSF
jgi:hypothetical protein